MILYFAWSHVRSLQTVELGRFQNYSISILSLELYSISTLVDFGRYSKNDFFTISILQNWVRIIDSSILIKINQVKNCVFLAFMPKNRLELGRFQNYSISIFADFGKYSKIDFFTISILKNWAKIVDSSISIKIDPALMFTQA